MAASEANLSTIPPGMRVYAIGDIHGRIDLLDELIERITIDLDTAPEGRAILIFLGDYIDRGPDSCGVIQWFLTGLPNCFEPIFLRGNHEEMLLRSLASPLSFENWAINGGLETARSYGVELGSRGRAHDIDPVDAIRRLRKALPQEHCDFLKKLPIAVELGDYHFVHAGVRPGRPLDDQALEDCLFIRDEFLNYRGDFGKIIVHGHTPMRSPDIRPNRIGIDTGAYFTGRLTALCLEGTTRRFLVTEGVGER